MRVRFLASALCAGLSGCAPFLASMTGAPRYAVAGGEAMPVETRVALRDIVHASGDVRIQVTSVGRDARRQVAAMLAAYVECDAPDCGPAKIEAVYDPECRDGLMALYEPRDSLNPEEAEAVLDRMGAHLEKTLAALDANKEPRLCMAHVGTAEKFAVDIDPASVRHPGRFVRAVLEADDGFVIKDRFLYPPIAGTPPSPVADPVFHVEFRRPAAD